MWIVQARKVRLGGVGDDLSPERECDGLHYVAMQRSMGDLDDRLTVTGWDYLWIVRDFSDMEEMFPDFRECSKIAGKYIWNTCIDSPQEEE